VPSAACPTCACVRLPRDTCAVLKVQISEVWVHIQDERRCCAATLHGSCCCNRITSVLMKQMCQQQHHRHRNAASLPACSPAAGRGGCCAATWRLEEAGRAAGRRKRSISACAGQHSEGREDWGRGERRKGTHARSDQFQDLAAGQRGRRDGSRGFAQGANYFPEPLYTMYKTRLVLVTSVPRQGLPRRTPAALRSRLSGRRWRL
jgi:hypothetical protein